jgi:hypothetical protein
LQIFIANAPQSKGNGYVLTFTTKTYSLWEWWSAHMDIT